MNPYVDHSANAVAASATLSLFSMFQFGVPALVSQTIVPQALLDKPGLPKLGWEERLPTGLCLGYVDTFDPECPARNFNSLLEYYRLQKYFIERLFDVTVTECVAVYCSNKSSQNFSLQAADAVTVETWLKHGLQLPQASGISRVLESDSLPSDLRPQASDVLPLGRVRCKGCPAVNGDLRQKIRHQPPPAAKILKIHGGVFGRA